MSDIAPFTVYAEAAADDKLNLAIMGIKEVGQARGSAKLNKSRFFFPAGSQVWARRYLNRAARPPNLGGV
jgi:hypothetical protein